MTLRGPFKRCGICSLTRSILSEAKSSYYSFLERNYFPFKMNFFIIIISKAILPPVYHIIKYRMSTQVNIVVDRAYLHRSCQVICNSKEYTIPLPTQKYNFLEIVTQLTFDKRYELLIQVIAKEKKELTLRQFYQVKEDCDRYFNVAINVDFDELALQMLNEANLLQDLDILPFKDIMTLFKKSYDNLSLKIHGKINRRLAKYLKTSKRSTQQKQNLHSLLNHIKGSSSQDELAPEKQEKIDQQDDKSKKGERKNRKKPADDNAVQKADHGNHGRLLFDNEHKQHNQPRKERPRRQRKEKPAIDIPVEKEQDNEDDWIQVPSDKEKPNAQKKAPHKFDKLQDHNEQKKQQIPKKYTEKKNNSGRNDNSNRRNSQSKERNPIKRQMRILLGINGASDQEWRQRIRPPKVPKQNIPQSSNRQKNRDNNESIKSKEALAEPQKKIIRVEEKEGQGIGRVFTYPDDGQQFKFKKDKTYNLFVNKSFWIKSDPSSNTVTIEKDGSGFIRTGIFQFSEDNDGLHGPGFSIQFSGIIHLQDGGKMFGQTELAKFLPDGKKTFKLKSLQIFAK